MLANLAQEAQQMAQDAQRRSEFYRACAALPSSVRKKVEKYVNSHLAAMTQLFECSVTLEEFESEMSEYVSRLL